MKKFLSVLLALTLVVGMLSMIGCSNSTETTTGDDAEETVATSEYRVAMITDYGDITDQSFNQAAYEACKAFAEEYSIDFKYYKPSDDSTSARVTMIETAISEGYNVIVMPGYAFAGAIYDAAPNYPDVKFIALDVGTGDFLEACVPDYDYVPDNWTLSDYYDMANVYSAIYQEELCGYMAGYAAVMLGYTKLGFLGGMAVPAVIRYGYGFVQGADDAAAELGITVEINYIYGGQFYGDSDITAVMDTWYSTGTEVVFACGGGIYVSAAEAAAKVNAKVIGVDVDQSGIIDAAYGDGMTVTSAMKGLYATTYDTLVDVCLNGNWDNYKGQIASLGLISDTDPTLNYVQIPYDTTQWSDSFTQADYVQLVADIMSGAIVVDSSYDTTVTPTVTNATVDYQGNIK